MNKKVLIILAVVVIIAGIITGFYIVNKNNKEPQNEVEQQTEISEKVTDECTEEYEQGLAEITEEANSEETKITPNAVITFQKYYKGCDHTVTRYEEVAEELVNGTQEDLQAKYEDWEIKSFTEDEIVLYQELEGECGEHYMLRDVDGKVNIYQIGTDGEETLLEETEIATEYLTETDMIDIENGLIVYGKESLNMLLEDFE